MDLNQALKKTQNQVQDQVVEVGLGQAVKKMINRVLDQVQVVKMINLVVDLAVVADRGQILEMKMDQMKKMAQMLVVLSLMKKY